jgi:hypothetical protein
MRPPLRVFKDATGAFGWAGSWVVMVCRTGQCYAYPDWPAAIRCAFGLVVPV